MSRKIILIAATALFAASCSEIGSIPPSKPQIACTQDAMQCPDGSWVGRSGPNCEFVCLQPPAK